jgi:hypothetical protein
MALLLYKLLQRILIEENNKYYLFNEKKLQEEYKQKTGEKSICKV